MVTIEDLRKNAMLFPEVIESVHFEKTSFLIRKKIFATYDIQNHRLCIKLSLVDQDAFSLFDPKIIYPVPNKWGAKGWTFIELSQVKLDICLDALKTAYLEVAPVKLSAELK